jgi:hypothetical protein
MPFDVDGARKAGYSDEEILQYLTTSFRKFDVQGAMKAGYSSQEIIDYLSKQPRPASIKPKEGFLRRTAPYVRSLLEYGGAALGGVAAVPASIATAPTGVGPVIAEAAGTMGGYMIGKSAADRYEELVGARTPRTLSEATREAVASAPEAVEIATGGPIGGKVIEGAAKGAGAVIKPLWGMFTGTGKAAIENAVRSGEAGFSTGMGAPGREATEYIKDATGKLIPKPSISGGIKSTGRAIKESIKHPMEALKNLNPFKASTEFDKALRGDLSGEEIVQNARGALSKVKSDREAPYLADFKKLKNSGQQIDLARMKARVKKAFEKYIRTDPKTGDLDWTRTTLGSDESVNKAMKIWQKVQDWGSKPGDNTPVGLDELKRNIDALYSETEKQHVVSGLISATRNAVKDGIVSTVPQYAKMTKNYEDATNLIKDIQSNLMMRKEGISGRITADQTLRRLMSTMRDNFELRRDLLRVLGKQGSADLEGQVAGHVMSSVIPRGLAGTTPGMASEAYLAWRLLSPEYYPLVAASSPRVAGEFLRLFGKFASEVKGTGPMVGKAIAYGATRPDAVKELTPDIALQYLEKFNGDRPRAEE